MVVDFRADDKIHRVGVAVLEEKLLQADVMEIIDPAFQLGQQSANAELPASVTPAGIVMLVRLLLCWNAPLAMLVTVRPLFVSGMVTSPPPVQPVMVIVLSLLVM